MTGSARVLIVGGAGQVGRELQRSFSGFGEITVVDRENLDIAVPEEIRAIIRRVRPQVILNAAAYTAVDRAESEPELAMAINAEAPRVLAEEARSSDAMLVHYSTDYVFDGSKPAPWTEEDAPHPLSVYGVSKLAGEEAIWQVGGRYLIFRTSWVYGPHGNNFLLTMLRLGRERDLLRVVDDQHGAPTTSIEIAHATHAIVEGSLAGRFGEPEAWAGLYHMSCTGATTWRGFAQAIFARTGYLLDGRLPEVKAIASSEYPTAAMRPLNSVLSNAKLQARFGVALAPWEAALEAVVERLTAAAAATKQADLPRE
ncbi:MAG: dTDP-4-dehydrorhamnose reductase [Acidobacteriaceae bacterium]|jgi:dTDP-4-dehydrorhamnose reductase